MEADYLFPTLESVPEVIHTPMVDVDIEAMMVVSEHGDVVLEEYDGYMRRMTHSRVTTARLVSLCLAQFY